jgi:hypothetical protein
LHQPILPAMDWMAAHCDECSSMLSKTTRTMRWMTSGGQFISGAAQRYDMPRTRKSGQAQT